MKKYMCIVCGYIHEGDAPPMRCPVCSSKSEQFKEIKDELKCYGEQRIGLAKELDKDIVEMLRTNFMDECMEVGMYLAMSRQADREGVPEIGEIYRRIALEEAEHAAKFAEILGEVVISDTKKNLEDRIEAEYKATEGKLKLAKKAKERGIDWIHDTVHEMCKDEARHGKAFQGILNRYYK